MKNSNPVEEAQISTKKRPEQHVIDKEGQKLFESLLPSEWVLRDYRPDYGLDFSLELFKKASNTSDDYLIYETLGEHLYIQLKSCKQKSTHNLQIEDRPSVERYPHKRAKGDFLGALPVATFSLDMAEIATIQRMGSALPVLLVLADLSEQKCYFICLNDYIDKILLPAELSKEGQKSKTIYIPLANCISAETTDFHLFRWYGKRAKLYSAFQKFLYQKVELDYLMGASGFEEQALHFAKVLARYDFWNDVTEFPLINDFGIKVKEIATTGNFSSIHTSIPNVPDDELDDFGMTMRRMSIISFWDKLASLSRIYEDTWREWYLPTGLGYMTSYN